MTDLWCILTKDDSLVVTRRSEVEYSLLAVTDPELVDAMVLMAQELTASGISLRLVKFSGYEVVREI